MVVRIRIFGSGLQFRIRGLHMLFGFFGVAAQFILVCFLRFVSCVPSFREMLLGRGEIGVLAGIDVFHWALCEKSTPTNQACTKDTAEKDISHIAPPTKIGILRAAGGSSSLTRLTKK